MTPARFLETRNPAWNRLDELVKKTRSKGVAALNDAELHELARLYPAVAVDVARARMYKIDAETQDRVNRLAIAAHGLLYRRPHARPVEGVLKFLAGEYPRLFRRMWPYVLLSVAIFGAVTAATYVSVRVRPAIAHRFVPEEIDLPDGKAGLSADDMSERFRRIPRPPLAAGVMANNISVAFYAFAFGITAGIGTCYVLLMNGMMLGGFAAHFANHHLGFAFLSFIMAHGVLEIMAILIAAAAGLRMGISLAMPGATTRKASLRAGAKEAVLLVLGTIPMFIIAGTLEGFVTPSQISGEVKIVIGIAVWAAVMAYLMLAGRSEKRVG